MNGDDIINKNNIELHSMSNLLTSSSNQPNQKNFSPEEKEEEEEKSSSGSSPSTLKKRLQELPSTARSIDRTSLSHRISRNREICHRSESARNYVEINEDNKEERNQITSDPEESSSVSSSHRSQGARARRRAKIRSEILEDIDKSLGVSRSSLNNFFNLIDKSDEELRSTGRSITDSVESIEESTRIEDCKDLSMLRRQAAFITGSLTSRSYYRDSEGNEKERNRVSRESKSAKEDRNSGDDRTANKLLKNRIELRPISQLPINVHPQKFGGYRPHTGIIINNLSSGSESDCFNDVTNYVQRKFDNPIVNTELLTPVSNNRTLEEGIKTLPVLSARNEGNHALPSLRSSEGTPRSRISISRDSRNREHCDAMNNNVNTSEENVRPYCEENFKNGEDIRENDVNSLPLRSTSTTISKSFLMDEKRADKKSFDVDLENEGRGDSRKISDETVRLLVRRKNFKSIDDLSTFPKRHKEDRSSPCSLKCTSRGEKFISTSTVDSESRSPRRMPNDDRHQREKTPSFLTVRLIEELEALKGLNTSDNEGQDNIANVPILSLRSEDASRSTSPGSKMCTQNRSPDRNTLTTAISNSRDKEGSSTRFRNRSCDDNERVSTFKSVSPDNIAMLSKTWQVPVSNESRNPRESYEEFDVTRQSRRAYSAPCRRLSNENPENATIDIRRGDDSKLTSDFRGYTQDERRCKSVDSMKEGICNKENFNQLSVSSYSSHFGQSTGSLSFVEDYQTLSDPLEMSYSRDEEFHSHSFDYVTHCMYPRQSHLSVLQEESETRLEENCRSESVIGKKDSSTVSTNYVNKTDENEKVSPISCKDENVIGRGTEGRPTSELDDTKDETDDDKSEDTNLNYDENNENSDTSTKNDSLSDTEESNTNSISPSSQSTNIKCNYQRQNWNNEDEKIKDGHVEGDNEFRVDKSYDETIDGDEYRSKVTYNKLNGSERADLRDTWLLNDRNSKLQFLTSVHPETRMFVIEKVHETCTVPPKISCSTSRLHCTSERTKDSPRSKNKKSQDRFPFTISETRSMISTSNKKQGHCESVGNKTRSLEAFRNYSRPVLKEFSKSPIEIVDCFNYGERQEHRNLVPKMKGLVWRFSNKFKISRKRNDLDTDDPTTKVIYQNRECRVDSMPDTNSDDSSIKESEWVLPRSANTRSSVISSGKSLKKATSLENLTLRGGYPRRRYDRDDVWVKELQERLPARDSAKTSSRERFSLLTLKSSGSSVLEDSKKSWRTSERNERISCKKEDQVRILGSCLPLASNVIESNVEFKNERNSDVDESSNIVESGCFCLQLFRMITCFIFTNSHDDLSVKSRKKNKNKYKKKRSRSSLKRRKG